MTSKQRAYLKGLAMKLEPVFQIGKSSLTPEVTQAVDDYKAWQTEQIGRAINPDELRKRMLNAGASRITLTAPVYTELDANEVAQFTSTSVTYQGVG